MLLRVQHETKFSYSEPISETVFEVRMAPPSDEDQTNLGYHLRTTPSAPVTIYRDGFGNRVDLFNILTTYQELVVRATSIVRMHRGCTSESRLSGVVCDFENNDFRTAETVEYLQPSPLVNRSPELDGFLAEMPKPDGALDEIVRRLIDYVRSRLAYEKKVTTARTPVGEALRLGAGSARILPTCSWGPVAGSACLHVMSADTSIRPARSRRMPGARSGAAVADGWTSTRPTGRSPAMATSRSPSDAITRTSPPTEASGKAGPARPSR